MVGSLVGGLAAWPPPVREGGGPAWGGGARAGTAGPGLPGSLQIASEENAEGSPARVQNRNRGLRAQLRPPAPLQVRWRVLTGCRALGANRAGGHKRSSWPGGPLRLLSASQPHPHSPDQETAGSGGSGSQGQSNRDTDGGGRRGCPAAAQLPGITDLRGGRGCQ